MKFFLATEYDFKTKTWTSGGRIIPNHAWAKSLKHELPFPVLNDQMMFLHNKNFWVTSSRREIGPYNWDKTLSKMKKEEFSKLAILWAFSIYFWHLGGTRSKFSYVQVLTGGSLL